MNKKIIIPSIVILLLLGLLAGVMMLDDAPSTNDGMVSSDASPYNDSEDKIIGYILDIDTESITAIDVTLGGEKFGFITDGYKWTLASNPRASISSGSVDSLLNAIGTTGYTESYSRDEMKRSDCGISETSDGISITASGDKISLMRGINTTDGKYTYLSSSLSEDIYLVPRQSAEKLFAPLDNYRNGAMINLDFEHITEVKLNNSNGLITLKKGESDTDNAVYNEWKLLSPIEVGANDESVKTKIIDTLKQIKISGYASDNGDYTSFGFGARDKYITLKDANGRSASLYFSENVSGKYYISVNDEPTIYEIALSDAPYIEMKAIDVADRNINLVKMVNISDVTIAGKDNDYKIEFLDKKGRINGAEVSYDDMNQKIFPAVCGLFADDIINGSAGETEIVIEYNYKDKTSDRLEFSSYNDRLYKVSKNGKVMYLILKSKINDLTSMLGQYK